MKKKVTISVLVIAILGVTAFLLFGRGKGKDVDFRFDTASEGDITMTVTATGTINAVTQVEVGTQVSGIIAKLYADFNSIVKEGQIIAQIDPTFLQQAVKDAEASLERSRAQYAEAKRNAERTQALFDKGMESQANNDAAATSFETSSAAMKQSIATLDRAKINLAYATIYAPINGVVIDRKVNVGQTVAASFSSPTLYTIANDLSKMQVLATIDESDIGKISTGQQATFTVDAFPNETFKGTVSQVRLAPVSIQNVVNYTVVVDVNNDRLKLMPGMTANVRVLVGNRKNVLRVSNLALRFQPPAELVDSAKIKEMRGAGRGMMGGRPEGMGPGSPQGAPEGMAQGRPEGMAQGRPEGVPDGGMRWQRPGGEGGGAKEKVAAAKTAVKRKGAQSRFGIQNNFPEYEKSSASPEDARDRGRVWIVGQGGKLEPVFIVTGLTDGKYTEVVRSQLQSGTQVILGLNSQTAAPAAATANPFSGQGQQRMGGPGGPR